MISNVRGSCSCLLSRLGRLALEFPKKFFMMKVARVGKGSVFKEMANFGYLLSLLNVTRFSDEFLSPVIVFSGFRRRHLSQKIVKTFWKHKLESFLVQWVWCEGWFLWLFVRNSQIWLINYMFAIATFSYWSFFLVGSQTRAPVFSQLILPGAF